MPTGGVTSPCPELGYYSIPGGCFCGRATMFYLVVLREERYYSIPGGTFCGPADTRVLSLFPSLPPLSSAHPPFIGTSCCVRPFLPSFCGGPELRYYSISTLGFCGPKISRRIIIIRVAFCGQNRYQCTYLLVNLTRIAPLLCLPL